MTTASRFRKLTVVALTAAALAGIAVFLLDLVVLGVFVIEALAGAAAILAMALLARVPRSWAPAVAGTVVAVLIAGSLTSPWVSGRLLHPAGQWEFFVPTFVGVVCGFAAAATGTAAALRERKPSPAGP